MKPSPTAQAEAKRILESAGCAACGAGALAERRSISAFVTELYTEPVVLRQVGDALGFCPVHSRALLRRVEASTVLRGPYAHVVATVLQRLAKGASPHRLRPCVVCASQLGAEEGATWFIMGTLDAPVVAQAYRTGGGFCLRHAIAALASARSGPAGIVTDNILTQLRETGVGPPLLARLAGHDSEPEVRHALRARLGTVARELTPPRHGTPVIQRLRELFILEACPACLEAALMELHYLNWLGEESRHRPDRLVSDGVRLCAGHLRDLLLQDAETGGQIGILIRDRAIWLLEQLRDQLDRSRLHSVRALWAGTNLAWKGARASLHQIFECSLCAARDGSERRTVELLLAALSDRTLRADYGRSHGLCLRHLPLAASQVRGNLLTRVLAARLSVLAWELEDAGRKSSWSNRHEIKGDEATAWFRAPALLDGWVFLGGPARSQMRGLGHSTSQFGPLEVANFP